MPAPLILVVFQLWDRSAGAAVSLRLSNLAHRRSQPLLITPVMIGSRIDYGGPGTAARLVPNGGLIQFGLNAVTRPWLAYRWLGSSFIVYTGNEGDDIATMTTAYVGRVAGLSHDGYVASVQIADNRLALDKPVVSDLYPDDAVPALAGRPKPWLLGTRNSIEPVLEDEATLTYRITKTPTGLANPTVTALRVGGVPWDYADPPGAGQYSYSTDGTLKLGSMPGGEIRVDATTGNVTVAGLLRLLALNAGGFLVDEAAVTALDAICPYLIGFYTGLDPINYQDAFDQIAGPQLCWWGFTDAGLFTMGAVQAPATGAGIDATLTTLDIASLRLSQMTPPAWRARVQYAAAENPATQFFDSVPLLTRQSLAAPGLIAPAYEDPTIQAEEPQAVDLPLIESLVNTQADALDIRTRAANLWFATGTAYDVEVERDDIALYDSVAVDYLDLPTEQAVTGNFRVYGRLRRLGGDRPLLLSLRSNPPLQGAILTEDSGFLRQEDGTLLLR